MQPFRSMASLTKAEELCHGQRRLLSKELFADQEVPPTRHGVTFTACTQFTHVTTRHAHGTHACMPCPRTRSQARWAVEPEVETQMLEDSLEDSQLPEKLPKDSELPQESQQLPENSQQLPEEDSQQLPDSQLPAGQLNSEELDGEELDEPDPEEERRAKQRAYHQMQRFKVSARAADFPQLARLLQRGTPAEKKDVMRQWMETNGNCAAMEGRLKLTAKMTAPRTSSRSSSPSARCVRRVSPSPLAAGHLARVRYMHA